MTASMIAVSNLKGGVGKSTTTLMLADGLAYHFGAEVLVVDLDAQANSSQMLLTERGLHMAFRQGKGVHHLVGQFMADETPDIAKLILPNAVTLEAIRADEEKDERKGWVSILPSHPQLRLTEMALEEKMYSSGRSPTQLANMMASHIQSALEPLMSLYDVILIDTPPYLVASRAMPHYLLAETYVTPTLADAVSTWGTKQFTDWVTNHVREDLPERNFVVVTRFRNTRYARDAESELKNVYLKDRTFGPTIPESVQALMAIERADLESYDTMRGKYGSLRGDVNVSPRALQDFSRNVAGCLHQLPYVLSVAYI